MARGGYHGLDPATTPDSLRRMVDQGQVRFAMLNDVLQLSRRLGADPEMRRDPSLNPTLYFPLPLSYRKLCEQPLL